MSLDHLWAGWRSSYVSSVSDSDDGPPGAHKHSSEEDPSGPARCVFCAIIASAEEDQTLHVVARREHSIAILNAYPYASGHLLVMPLRHLGDVSEMSDREYQELFLLAREAMQALERAYGPDGMNIGANFGRAAGAGIPRHLHLHVLPRWVGDTNFMTTVASVRVMPEALDDSWRKLREAWPQ